MVSGLSVFGRLWRFGVLQRCMRRTFFDLMRAVGLRRMRAMMRHGGMRCERPGKSERNTTSGKLANQHKHCSA
jgi:hypothetical protein